MPIFRFSTAYALSVWCLCIAHGKLNSGAKSVISASTKSTKSTQTQSTALTLNTVHTCWPHFLYRSLYSLRFRYVVPPILCPIVPVCLHKILHVRIRIKCDLDVCVSRRICAIFYSAATGTFAKYGKTADKNHKQNNALPNILVGRDV